MSKSFNTYIFVIVGNYRFQLADFIWLMYVCVSKREGRINRPLTCLCSFMHNLLKASACRGMQSAKTMRLSICLSIYLFIYLSIYSSIGTELAAQMPNSKKNFHEYLSEETQEVFANITDTIILGNIKKGRKIVLGQSTFL